MQCAGEREHHCALPLRLEWRQPVCEGRFPTRVPHRLADWRGDGALVAWCAKHTLAILSSRHSRLPRQAHSDKTVICQDRLKSRSFRKTARSESPPDTQNKQECVLRFAFCVLRRALLDGERFRRADIELPIPLR
jgi:hypothetical protein